jgi:hypothetical protein
MIRDGLINIEDLKRTVKASSAEKANNYSEDVRHKVKPAGAGVGFPPSSQSKQEANK